MIMKCLLILSVILCGCTNNGKKNIQDDPPPAINIDLPSNPGVEIVIPLEIG